MLKKKNNENTLEVNIALIILFSGVFCDTPVQHTGVDLLKANRLYLLSAVALLLEGVNEGKRY